MHSGCCAGRGRSLTKTLHDLKGVAHTSFPSDAFPELSHEKASFSSSLSSSSSPSFPASSSHSSSSLTYLLSSYWIRLATFEYAFFRIAGRAFELLFSSAAHILLCFGASNRFGAQAALNGLNGHRMRNGKQKGKELQGTLHSSARFMTSTRSDN
ncbi:uncharacterized protein MONOS_15081 [Monocercomonoides exilis]|uniref:uncharacterized protein n=1 Tax=Monocercomonoides exilis TaxID=2049356 RepID=UPI003559FAB8|nr:hypothetical protein MONOS_15081 [Monocercomonoides exilis]|eukprot:MONOS_15081.1-p1 / transcript=MONOS_15081.1 / gene=MONOS_15081 / organism=Monocercomonoides_exilis_PA203 / gene_product=unspecified product / transcript_product=unspecified product / location=Mono_scaffold01139:6782-7336(-) / protein_length=155 / sequence_SO=supercontig / SO=protein_coding / is_pseudo=false